MNKNRKVTIRLTESQMKRLTDTLIEEQITKSQLIREMINKYVRFSRRTDKSNVLQKINEIRDINNEIQ
jgi:DNA-binding transcriptional regulator YbjK